MNDKYFINFIYHNHNQWLQAIECMGFDTINKVFLVYDSAWWGDDLQGIQLIWDGVEKSDPDHQVIIDTSLSVSLNELQKLKQYTYVQSDIDGGIIAWCGTYKTNQQPKPQWDPG